MPRIVVRSARRTDLGALGALGGALAREHHAADPGRFMEIEDPEGGYSWWLGKELANKKAVVLVAERGAEVVGYAYGRLEPKNWNALLDAHGALHDIYVLPGARRLGAASLLAKEMMARLKKLGAPRVVLSTMTANLPAQKLFERLGFRVTMLEMTSP